MADRVQIQTSVMINYFQSQDFVVAELPHCPEEIVPVQLDTANLGPALKQAAQGLTEPTVFSIDGERYWQVAKWPHEIQHNGQVVPLPSSRNARWAQSILANSIDRGEFRG